ncbi:MAG: serpin family protein [Lachnospiraceae bacterium]|nr:serpin family protein [Lachnospiraceae bacterium]
MAMIMTSCANKDTVTIIEAVPASFQSSQENPSDEATIAATGANDFAFRLSAMLIETTTNGSNFVCSPYSVWLPLAALVNATDKAHKESLIAAIGAAGISEDDINTAASRMLYDLTKQGKNDKDQLRFANAIFVGDSYTLRQSFADCFSQYYGGTMMSVDFASPKAAETVNQWASDHTEGLVTEIVKASDFNSSTVAAIANAIYFSGNWEEEFYPGATKDYIFHSPTGNVAAPFMIRTYSEMNYYEDEKVQAVTLGFVKGGGMTFILPKDGAATGLLQAMTSEYYDTIMNKAKNAIGRLFLPRFSFDSGIMDLKDTLIRLGVPLFDEREAPLTGGLIEGNDPVWLGMAVQRAVIEVDEKGTTAAAVTVMSSETGGMWESPKETFAMVCDRPFVFVLYGQTYDGGRQVLFTGVVNEP